MPDAVGRYRQAASAAADFPDQELGQPTAECQPAASPGQGPLDPVPARPRSWIGVRVEHSGGSPIAGEPVVVELGGGRILRGRTAANGEVRFEDVEEDEGVTRVESAEP